VQLGGGEPLDDELVLLDDELPLSPQTPGWLPPQIWGALQVPHSMSPPQPSPAGPQLNPSWAQLIGVQLPDEPQTFGLPPPQIWGALQVPHSMSPPQPSPTGPQLYPSWGQVLGTQPPDELLVDDVLVEDELLDDELGAHIPLLHVVPDGHGRPHAPQLLGSLAVSAHTVPHIV
jgi:hypothetical protein